MEYFIHQQNVRKVDDRSQQQQQTEELEEEVPSVVSVATSGSFRAAAFERRLSSGSSLRGSQAQQPQQNQLNLARASLDAACGSCRCYGQLFVA